MNVEADRICVASSIAAIGGKPGPAQITRGDVIALRRDVCED